MSVIAAAIETTPFPKVDVEKPQVFVAVAGACIIRVDGNGNYFTRISGQEYPAQMGREDGLVEGVFHFTLNNPLG